MTGRSDRATIRGTLYTEHACRRADRRRQRAGARGRARSPPHTPPGGCATGTVSRTESPDSDTRSAVAQAGDSCYADADHRLVTDGGASASGTQRGTFVLVGCGAAKADEPRPAANLYTSNYFALKRRYAEAATAWAGTNQSSAWAVLSAEHGVIPNGVEIAPYDRTIEDLDADEREAWADRVRSALTSWLNWPFRSDNDPRESPCGRLVVLAGEKYIQPLEDCEAFKGTVGPLKGQPGLPVVPEFPFREHDLAGIGEQMAWLKQRAEQLEAVGPASRAELSAFGGGYERERPLWQLDRPAINIEETEQASLDVFEDPEKYLATEQQQLEIPAADGGNVCEVGAPTEREGSR